MDYVLGAVNRDGATHGSTVINVDGKTALKDKYCMVMIDGHLTHYSVEIRNVANEVGFAAKPTCLRYAF